MSNKPIYVCEVTLRGSQPKQTFLKPTLQNLVDEIKEVFWQNGIYRDDMSQPLEKWEWENERQGAVREVHHTHRGYRVRIPLFLLRRFV